MLLHVNLDKTNRRGKIQVINAHTGDGFTGAVTGYLGSANIFGWRLHPRDAWSVIGGHIVRGHIAKTGSIAREDLKNTSLRFERVYLEERPARVTV